MPDDISVAGHDQGSNTLTDEDGAPLVHVEGNLYARHPAYVNLLPSTRRERLTYEELCERARAEGLPEPTRREWADTIDPTPFEIEIIRGLTDVEWDARIEDLRDYFFVRKLGNKPRVCWRQPDGSLGHMSPGEFKNAHQDKWTTIHVRGKSKSVPLAEYWLRHERTPRYDSVAFLPGKMPWEVPPGVYNLWSGWPEGLPRPRDLHPLELGEAPEEDDAWDGPNEPEECSLFLEHLYENVCRRDDDAYNFVLGYMADSLLRPGLCEVAIVMKGPSGSGKGTFAHLFGSLFGPHYFMTSHREHIVGKFNRHLMETSLLYCDEVDFEGRSDANKQLRSLITEPTMPVELKGVDVVQAPKHFRVIISTNEEHVIAALKDDRRFLVLEVDAGEHNQDREYFGAIRRQWENGGRVALFRWLTGRYWRAQLAAGAWHVGQRPITAALQRQKDLSLGAVELAIHNMLTEGEPPCEFATEVVGGETRPFVPTQALADARKLPANEHTKLGRLLRMLTDLREGEESRRVVMDGKQRRGYVLVDLAECRRRWEVHLGRAVEWPPGAATWALPVPFEETPF